LGSVNPKLWGFEPRRLGLEAQSQEPQLSKKEKAEQARDLYTRQFIARIEALMEVN